MSVSDLVNTTKKKIIKGAIALAAIVGTYGGNDGGFAPFNNKKIGHSYGINIGAQTEFQPYSKFYGINLSCYSDFQPGSEFNGLSVSFKSDQSSSTFNGVKCSGVNDDVKHGELNGLEIGIMNLNFNGPTAAISSNKVNGLQIGLANQARAGHVGQIGIYNAITRKDSAYTASFLLNYGWEK